MKMSKRFWIRCACANRREERPKVSMMRFKSGNHEGKTAEEVFIKHPDFAQWTIERYPGSPHGQAFIRLTQQFDDKPFTADCHRECGQKATRASANRDGGLLFFWCDNCDPFSTGVHGLRIIHALSESLQHVDLKAGGNRALKRRIVRRLAAAKGLPKRVGEKEALEFFSQAPTYDCRAEGVDHQGVARRRKRGRVAMFRR